MVQRADNCSNFNIIDALLAENLFHLVEDIFVRLDSQSLTNAENSSNHWSQFVQLSGRLYRKKMATISSWLFINAAVVSKKSSRHSIYIWTVGNDDCFAELVRTSLWDIWAQQLTIYNVHPQFLARVVRKEKLKSTCTVV